MPQNCTNDLCYGTLEPEPPCENKPGHPPPANDDAAEAVETAASLGDTTPRNEPDEQIPPRLAALRAAILAGLAARRADPVRDRAILDDLVPDYWVAHTGLPIAAAAWRGSPVAAHGRRASGGARTGQGQAGEAP